MIFPSRTSATRQADSGTFVPLWATTFIVYCTTKPSSKVLMHAVVVGAPAVEVTTLGERREVLLPADLLAGDVEPHRHVGCVAAVDGIDVAALDRVEERVAQATVLGVDSRHGPSAFSSARPNSRPAASTSKIV